MERVVRLVRSMTTTMGQLVSDLFARYEREFNDSVTVLEAQST
jgi:hypothetical protein